MAGCLHGPSVRSCFYAPRVELTLQCADGVVLSGTVFEPAGEPLGITVVVCGAVFVRERFYARMAEHLADRGCRVVTFANRGSGRSWTGQGAPRLLDWGLKDLPAAIQWALGSEPGDRLFVVGHSMGGQLVGMSSAVHALEGVITVAATEAWWGHWPRRTKAAILAAFVGIPVLGRMSSSFPADRSGLGPNLASSVVRDWARWGRTRGYLWAQTGRAGEMSTYRGRVLALSFSDDELLGCANAVDALHRRWTSADIERRHVQPRDLGVGSIGHFGWFRKDAGPAAWDDALAWMDRPVEA
jgi:predicted alpha/beta hydrolase